MLQTKLLEKKLELVLENTDVLIFLKNKKYEEVKIYLKQLFQLPNGTDSCYELICLIESIEEKKNLLNCIDFNDQKKLLFSALKKFNPTLIDSILTDSFVEKINDHYFVKILLFLLQKEILKKAALIMTWRKALSAEHLNILLDYALGYAFFHGIHLKRTALQLLCEYGADPMGAYKGKLILIDAIEKDNVIAVEFFLEDIFLNHYTQKELVMIFESLIKEGWLTTAENMLQKKGQMITSAMSALEIDSIFYALVNEYDHSKHLVLPRDSENFLKVWLMLGANPLRNFQVEGVDTNAFARMQSSWEWMLSSPWLEHFDEQHLLAALVICVKAPAPNKNSLVKNALIHKQSIDAVNLKSLDYIFYKLTVERKIDNELHEHCIFLGANPFANYGSRNVFDIVWHLKQEYKLECILEHYLQKLSESMLAMIFSAALKHHWNAIHDLILSPQNFKKTLMIDKLQSNEAQKFINDVLQDEKPDKDFLQYVLKHSNIHISLNESVLQYATEHDMIKEILACPHTQRLPFQKSYHLLQFILSAEHFAVRFKNFELLQHFNNMEAEPYLKRKGLIGVLHHEINKTKSVPEVLKIIKFIEEHKKNFRFMRDNLLHDDWKSLRQTAFQQINKIASLQQDIVFSNVNESVEVKNFMKAETKYHFFQKKTYDLLVKDKIKVLTEESITKNILAQ